MTDDALLNELLERPVGPTIAKRKRPEIDAFTKEISITGNVATVEIADEHANEGTALRFLEDEGQSPDDWEVSHFRKIEYGNDLTSVRFSFRRVGSGIAERAAALDSLLTEHLQAYPAPLLDIDANGEHGFLVLIGDMQFGKIDGDGPAGTLARTINGINRAADALARYRTIYNIGHVHIAWLGDHIEGFVSQGGANVWRTPLTLNEQIRLTQAVMLHALKTFAPLAGKVTMAAVPGNHGEAVRFQGAGVTRYDDSHDTEALVSIHNTIKTLEISGYEHVEFYVPDTDELTVVCEVAGTVIAHAHGHKFGSRKDAVWYWWEGQAFDRKDSAMRDADVLVAGHLHHEHIESRGNRLFVQVPALESESTWWRHKTGVSGDPGVIVGITKDGRFDVRETIHL